MKRRGSIVSKRGLCCLIIVLAAVLCFVTALGNLQSGQRQEGRAQLETALRRTAVACYAAEGVYPPNVEYMESYYGLRVDKDHYTVFYEVFAENLMPDITVIEKE